jgi:cyclase
MVELHDLNNDAYAVTDLFHPSGKGVNAGFLLTSKVIIHIDAGMTVADGNQLLAYSRGKATTQNRLLLILTHHHSDHIFGMRPIKEAGARIIAHKNVDDFLSFRTPPLFRSALSTYKPFIIKSLIKTYSYTKQKAEQTLENVRLFFPDEFFKEDIDMQVDDDKLALLCTPGHVPSEISVYHARSKTLFAGDAIYEGMPLTTRFGGPKEWKLWIESLKKLDELEIEKIVPGHGKICGKTEIKRNMEYLENLLDRQKAHR